MDPTALLIAKRPAILAAAERWGAHNVRVFGSVARGEADESSDVDLLVDLAPGRTLMDLGGLYMDLSALLGCELDLVTEGGLKGEFRVTVLGEAVEIEALEERAA
jgi:hypothetical protein